MRGGRIGWSGLNTRNLPWHEWGSAQLEKEQGPGCPGPCRTCTCCAADRGTREGLPAAAAAAAATAAATTAEAAAATAAAATEAATTTTAAAFAGLGFVDGQVTAIDVLAVESSDRCLRFGVVGHFHKAETAGTARLAVHDE